VLGEVPGVPFADGSYDAVLASFVVSHLTEYGAGLGEIVRVLRPGGRLGVTAWGPPLSEYGQLWQEVAESFVDRGLLLDAARQGVPWEQWFTDPVHLRQALGDAGLINVELRRGEYKVTMTVAAYLMALEISLKGKAMRQTLTAAEWKRFRTTVADEFRTRFGESISYTAQAHLAVGTRS
jgi:ubiquinone/menaquinone biosynthesis C-methylase UbiE